MKKYILCFSGGKDSTAMLIHLLEQNKLDIEKGFWKKHQKELKDKRMKARTKYNKNGGKYNEN